VVALTNQTGLANWYAAIQSRYYAPAKVMVMGDSISEGVITTTPTYLNRWQYLLQQQLRAAFPVSDVLTPGVGYMPACYADTLISDDTTRVDAVDILTQWGLGAKCVTVNPSQTITWPAITCERIRVHYGKSNFLSGGGKVLVDTVDQGVTLSSVDGAGNSDGYVWDSGTLTLASHVVTLQGNTSNRFFADGVEFYTSARDAASGIRVYDAAHSGTTSATMITSLCDVGHWQCVATLKPNLTIVMIGVNDWGNLTPSTYLTNMTTLLGKIATANGSTPYSVLLVLPYKPVKTNGAVDPDWFAYRDGLRAMATGNIAFYDLQYDWPLLVPGGSTSAGLMYESAAPVHPDVDGHARIAELLYTATAPAAIERRTDGTYLPGDPKVRLP